MANPIPLIAQTQDASSNVRIAASSDLADDFGSFNPTNRKHAVDALLKLLSNEDPETVEAAARSIERISIGKIRRPAISALPALMSVIESKDARVRLAVGQALTAIRPTAQELLPYWPEPNRCRDETLFHLLNALEANDKECCKEVFAHLAHILDTTSSASLATKTCTLMMRAPTDRSSQVISSLIAFSIRSLASARLELPEVDLTHKVIAVDGMEAQIKSLLHPIGRARHSALTALYSLCPARIHEDIKLTDAWNETLLWKRKQKVIELHPWIKARKSQMKLILEDLEGESGDYILNLDPALIAFMTPHWNELLPKKRFSGPKQAQRIQELLQSSEPGQRYFACVAATRFKGAQKGFVPLLVKIIEEDKSSLSYQASKALHSHIHFAPRYREQLVRIKEDTDDEYKVADLARLLRRIP